MNIKIKRITETAKIPTRGSEYAAGGTAQGTAA